MAKVDFHVHSEFSIDSSLKIEKIIAKAEKEDFYVAISDHNEIAGYFKARNLDSRRVIPAVEVVSSEGIHLLFYFINEKTLVSFFKEAIEKNRSKDLFKLKSGFFQLVKQGKKHHAFIGIPHPFTRKIGLLNCRRFKNGKKYLKYADFYEIHTSSLPKFTNKKAENYHKNNLTMPVIAGSDAHFLKDVGRTLLEVKNFKSLKELFGNLKNKTSVNSYGRFKIFPAVRREFILFKKTGKKDYFRCRTDRIFN